MPYFLFASFGTRLKRGFKILKCGQIPAKADVAAQKAFYDDILRPLMKRVKDGANGALLFMDASHFVMGCDFLGRVYFRRATQVCEMLRKILAEYAGKTVRVILDNARYRKCQAVRELALELGIELLHIPPYSPNLNLIERFRKFVKGELRSKYYDNFNLFQETINSLIQSATGKNRQRVVKLIGEKVQLFDDLRLIIVIQLKNKHQ